MKLALEHTKGTYNDFSVSRTAALLKRLEQKLPGLTFAPGRENSPVVYIAGSREDLLVAWAMARRSGADEIDISASATYVGPFFSTKARNIPEQAFIRLWWD
jgi:hypothetical protein